MDIQKLVELKSRFVARESGNEMILVPLTNNVAQMSELFTLNETARFIWENATSDVNIDGLVSLMTENFDIDNSTAEKDINNFLKHIETILH